MLKLHWYYKPRLSRDSELDDRDNGCGVVALLVRAALVLPDVAQQKVDNEVA